MRVLRFTLSVVAVVAVVGLLGLNWYAQRQTQQKLDALAAAIAERSATPAPETPTATVPPPGAVPRELDRVDPPPYVIEAPDMLLVEAVLKDPKTGATDRLPTQPVSGQFLVRPDGTVGLGLWGSVPVSGLTMPQASEAIRNHLAKAKSPELPVEKLAVVVDVVAYNSKRYYVITDGAGRGEQVFSFPLTGSETVLDAITGVNGLADAAGKAKISVARRPANPGQPWQNLPVDWRGITESGVTTTNYQLLPGDRLYVRRSGKESGKVPPELE